MFKNWKKILENRKGFSKLEKKGCSNTRNLVILFKKCAKVQSHIARQKRGARTHSARTVPKTFPHALPHAHRTCGSAIIRTCAPQPNICLLYIHNSVKNLVQPSIWVPYPMDIELAHLPTENTINNNNKYKTRCQIAWKILYNWPW